MTPAEAARSSWGILGRLTRADAAALTFDELEAAGYCDCGARLAGHPPLRRKLAPKLVTPWRDRLVISGS